MRISLAILAGGAGTRLWPLSNNNKPKQLLRLFGDHTLLQSTFLRVCHPDIDEFLNDVCIITNKDYLDATRQDLAEISNRKYKTIVEPLARSTAPAISAFVAHQYSNSNNNDEIVCILPSDHFFENDAKFRTKLLEAAQIAEQGDIVTLGVKPTSAQTGFGYIRPHDIAAKCSQIASFHEKPDAQTALSWYLGEQYYWNCGIFVARLDVLRDAFQSHTPRLWALSTKTSKSPQADNDIYLSADIYQQISPASFDIAIMEKTDHAKVIPLDAGWTDLGTWDSVYRQYSNQQGKCQSFGFAEASPENQSKPNLIIGNKSDVKILGLDGVLVINSDKFLIIAANDKFNDIDKLRGEITGSASVHANFPDKIQEWLSDTLTSYTPQNDELQHVSPARPYVAARHIYVYCHAAANFDTGYKAKAADLWEKFNLPWQKDYDPNNNYRSSYDIAHSLLACAWAYKLFPSKEIKKSGVELLDYLIKNLSDGIFGGYQEHCSFLEGGTNFKSGPRSSNSHMHLLEAFIAWYQITNSPIWLEKATQIVDLFTSQLFSNEWHCAPEYYDHSLNPIDSRPEKNRVEIGHMYEWIWLLYQYQVLTGQDKSHICRKLFSFANTWGTNPETELVFDANTAFGDILSDTSRCWPQAERLKAQIAMQEMGAIDHKPQIVHHAKLIFDKFIDTDKPGLWVDKIARDGTIIDARPAASSLYHLYGCYYEFIEFSRKHKLEKAFLN